MYLQSYLNRAFATPLLRRGAAAAVIVTFLLLWVLAVYGGTTAAMVEIWKRSETFAHGFVIVPLFLFLVWRERGKLMTIDPKPFLPALLGMAVAGCVWLLATRVGVNSAAQFAMMAMIPLGVWSVLGAAVLKSLGFPLAFLFFAIPFGEFLMPTLMDQTAEVTVLALRLSGIPVYREGNDLLIPTGYWTIVEACSGIRYLIASLMVGTLFAYLSYRSTARRVAFIAVSLAVPIVANWIRAYAIVMLGHLTGNKIAAGADHLVYGWLFFGVVMAVLFLIGVRWREDGPHRPEVSAAPAASPRPWAEPASTVRAFIAVLAIAAVWPALEALSGDERAARNVRLSPVNARNGWMAVQEAAPAWRPDISGARAELTQTFLKDDIRVGLDVALYREQAPGARAITSTNQIVRTTNVRWRLVGDDSLAVEVEGRRFDVRTAVVTDGRERLAVWSWFWVDGRTTASAYVAKLYEVWSTLQGRGDAVAWVVIFTDATDGEAASGRALQAFTAEMRRPINATLRQAAGER